MSGAAPTSRDSWRRPAGRAADVMATSERAKSRNGHGEGIGTGSGWARVKKILAGLEFFGGQPGQDFFTRQERMDKGARRGYGGAAAPGGSEWSPGFQGRAWIAQ